MQKPRVLLLFHLLLLLNLLWGAIACTPRQDMGAGSSTPAGREALIPAERDKVLPETDLYPPSSLSDEYGDPHPLPYPVNTAGAEDSAFILPGGETLYFWFTPDAGLPAEKQLGDGVTGICVAQRTDSGWGMPQRVQLQDPGKLALDGCAFVFDDLVYFCSAREGFSGLNWFSALQRGGAWGSWAVVDFPKEYQVGELYITPGGDELYFHSDRPGGMGGFDIWVSPWLGDRWGEPVNLAAVNSDLSDGWPFVSADGRELWLTRFNGAPELWRSRWVDGAWSPPQRMFAPFAGEASLDLAGNVYFTHHFYKDGVMLEADIYVAERRGE